MAARVGRIDRACQAGARQVLKLALADSRQLKFPFMAARHAVAALGYLHHGGAQSHWAITLTSSLTSRQSSAVMFGRYSPGLRAPRTRPSKQHLMRNARSTR